MIIAIEAKLKFHLLGNLELEFAFMIDFLKRMVLGYYLESRLVSRPHSNATRIRWQDIDMYSTLLLDEYDDDIGEEGGEQQ